jgi:trimeric autotransporter adhesin
MRLPLLLCVTTLAASTALAQQAGQSSPSSSSSKSQTDPSSQTGTSTQPGISSQPGQSSSSTLGATGKGAGYAGQQQHFRSTKIVGAQVKSSSGEDVGRIEDVVLNPSSGRIDFAIISSESKLVPVPWQLLSVSGGASAQGSTSSSSSTTSGTSTSRDPSSTSPSSTPSATSPSSSGIYASASAAGGQPTFTLNADKSKLQAAPSFDRSRWPEMSASWSQRVYSAFGVQPETGAGGTGAGSFRGSQGSTTDQGSTGTSSDKSSGKSSSDPEKSSDPSKSSSDPK